METKTHDVFISYSSKDKSTADAVCAKLENDGTRCWMAPRDILPGQEWSEAIIDGIEGSRVFLLVFSSNANASPQIKREVECAVNRNLVVVPFRIEDVTPAKTLEYFISTPHWLDAMTPPLEKHINYLADTLRVLLERAGAPVRDAPPSLTRVKPWWRRKTLLSMAVALVLLGLFFIVRTPSPIESEMIGSWEFVDVVNNATWSQQNRSSGEFDVVMTLEERGSFKEVYGGRLSLDGRARQNTISSWQQLNTAQIKADALVPSQFC